MTLWFEDDGMKAPDWIKLALGLLGLVFAVGVAFASLSKDVQNLDDRVTMLEQERKTVISKLDVLISRTERRQR